MLLSAIMCVQMTCRQELPCRGNDYVFSLNLKVLPNTDSVRIGDTIWFEINEPTTLKDATTGNMIDYSGVDYLSTRVSFSRLSNGSFSAHSVNTFKFIDSTGVNMADTFGTSIVDIVDTTLSRVYRFDERGGFYGLVIGLVPRRTGIFSVSFSGSRASSSKVELCSSGLFLIQSGTGIDPHYKLNPLFTGDSNALRGDYYFKVY